ncbi:hypothetical protein M1B72_03220 [Geomonas paludis]|uniref:Uncharacterized protein n=1 Tax=Geomonas paludis TaxID=2740185 RepID=A0ABY4LG18_9BACT|nr:hypothetical protein [Geomonas paludis]UPU36734.1 hypothetical protein M1B72_03220 [Geomonas paludis]
MRKMVSAALLLTLALAGGAFAALPPAGAKPAQVVNPHGASGAQPLAGGGLAEVIRSATLNNYRSMKVGEAFDRYSHFKVKAWREARGAAGTIYVDFCGSTPTGFLDFKTRREGITSKGVEVKFVIYPNGEYGIVMVSKTVVKDGRTTRYPMPDIKGVVDAIYANKKLDL